MKLLQLSPVLFLSACASTQYIEPSNGPYANISFKNSSAFESGISIFKEHETCKGQLAAVPSLLPGKTTTIKINASQPVSIGIGVSNGYDSCFIPATFKPVENKNYIAVITSSSAGCGVLLLESENGKEKEIEWKKRERVTPFSASSSFCK